MEGIPDRRISAMHTLYRDAEAGNVNLDEVFLVFFRKGTLQGINISHLGKIIFKMPFLEDMLVPWRVFVPSTNPDPPL